MLRKMLDKDCSFEEVHSHYPQISAEEWNTFKEAESTPARIPKWGWGKKMRENNVGDHTLGTHGYAGKQPIWDQEDAKRGPDEVNPWDKFKDPLAHRAIRARYKEDKVTGELKTGNKVLILEKKILVRNLPV